jgi:hypothetical protein
MSALRSIENENEFLRRELERKEPILLNMTEAIKALNPPTCQEPPEARESPETVEEEPERAEERAPRRWPTGGCTEVLVAQGLR